MVACACFLRPVFTTTITASRIRRPPEKLIMPRASKLQKEKVTIMGDKSPKSNQKKSSQKQSKASSVASKKKQAVDSKKSVAKKK
jgi:hypothetical protein